MGEEKNDLGHKHMSSLQPSLGTYMLGASEWLQGMICVWKWMFGKLVCKGSGAEAVGKK